MKNHNFSTEHTDATVKDKTKWFGAEFHR